MEIVYVAAAIIGWIVGLCAVGELAHAKGFSQVRWIIAAVFFNPLVLLFVILLPMDQLGIDERRVRQEERVRCRYCRETMHPEATVCPHCRSDVTQ